MKSIVCGLALLAATASAQTDRGTITGAVTDIGGAYIAGVSIIATHLDTNTQFKAIATEAGEFNLQSLPVGLYRVALEHPGFKTAIHESVRLEAGSTARLDTKLEVGSVQQSIEVLASATQLQSDNAKVQNYVSDELIEGLPTVMSDNMRSPFDLAVITAGVNGGDQDFRIAGGQAASFGVMLDGASANTNRAGSTLWAAVNAPALGAITEFAVEINGFKAEFGRAGGGLVTFVSKSGTNDYHGAAFDFIRNNAFDARGFFNSVTPVYRQHDFGATLGGPVHLPTLYSGRNRTFFFFSYEGFRNRKGTVTSVTGLPPAEFYQGDFRNAVSRSQNKDGTYIRYNVYDPATTSFDGKNYVRDPFPDNMVPLDRFDPIAKKILAIAQQTFKPLRTDVLPGTPQYWLENYWQRGTSINPNNKYSVKLDHTLNDLNRLSFYFGYNKRESVPGPDGAAGIPGILNPFQVSLDTSPVYRISWDRTLSPRLHNRFYMGINRFRDSNFPLSQGGNWKDKICIGNVPDCNSNLPIININDFSTWGGSGFNGSENYTYSFNDDFTFTRGKHIFKAGYLYELAPYVGLGQQAGAGNTTFTTGMTALPAQSSRNVGGGLGFASFVLGDASSVTINTPRRVGMHWRYHAMYFQDDWRIAPKLTLNLGMRYEFNLPAVNDNGQCADFDRALANPGAGGRPGALRFCGTGPGRIGRDTIPQGWYKGFGPRFGFAWSVDTKTVVRASGGGSYAPVKTVGGSAHFQGFAQILTFPDQTGGIQPVFKLNQGVPYYPLPPFIDPTFGNNGDVDWWQGRESNRLPEIWSWTLTVQREVKRGLLLEIGYSAMIGTHLIASLLNYNQPDINTLPSGLNIFTNAGRNLLNTTFDNGNRLVQNAGFTVPYSQFPPNSTLARSLRPFPQYNNVITSSGGDHSGHSSYHSFILKVTRRYANGLVIDASYVLSKMFTDADTVWANNTPAAIDQYNRRLEKALSAYDRTHDGKINYVYDLPIGPRKRFLNHGIVSQTIGGWRVGATQHYASGYPIGLTGAYGFPLIGNRPYITTYVAWRAPTQGDKFDPYVDRYFKMPSTASFNGDVATVATQGFFPYQPRNQIGNMTRNNPKMRNFPLFNENVSLAKTFTVSAEHRRTLDIRFEGFNVLNRTQFGTPNTNLNDPANFGLVRSQANAPRAMQFAAKFNW